MDLSPYLKEMEKKGRLSPSYLMRKYKLTHQEALRIMDLILRKK